MCGRTACALVPATLRKACTYRDPKTKKYRKPKWRQHPKVKNSEPDPVYYPSYNVFPSRFTPILFKDQESNQIILQSALWKLIPPWHKGDPTDHGWSTFNCRIEGLSTSKLFRPALVRRRCCIIPIQGFFEWKMERGKDGQTYKQPYFICMTQSKKYQLDHVVHNKSWEQGKWNSSRGWSGPKILMLAGLYNVWRGPGGELIYSYSIITKQANQKLSKIHNRSPVILRREQIMAWLDPKEDASVDEMLKFLQKSPPNVTPYAVSTQINNARCNYEGCVEQISLKRKSTWSHADDDEMFTKKSKN